MQVNKRSPARVYLDSSDFSVLSVPDLPPELRGIRKQLFEFKRAGLVQFWFSDAHVFEMLPIGIDTSAADARAEFLAELCGRHALRRWPDLVIAELTRLVRRGGDAIDCAAPGGQWMPMAERAQPIAWERQFASVPHEQLDLFVRKGQLTPLGQSEMARRRGPFNYGEMVSKLPLRESDARTLHLYAVGKRSAADANAAILGSLRDPAWMIKWFARYGRAPEASIWIRDAGERVRRAFAKYAEDIITIKNEQGINALAPSISLTGWHAKQLEHLCGLGNEVIEAFGLDPGGVPIEDPALFDTFAPGFSLSTQALFAAGRSGTLDRPRTAKGSDFADSAHAFFIPYMNVFRCDGFMAPVLTTLASRHGTTVVGKLTDLGDVIEGLLWKR